MSDYDNTNTITIWFKKPDANPNAPSIKVEINDNGDEVEYALWKKGPNDNPNGPAYKGKVEHKHSDKSAYSQQSAQPSQPPAPAGDGFDDSTIPF